MNGPDFPRPEPDAEAEASLWAARLDGTQLTLSQRRELERWLDADARHRPLLERYCRVSAEIEPALRVAVQAGRIEFPDTARQPSRRRFWIPVSALAAATCLLLVWSWLPTRPTWNPGKFATAPAERQKVELVDGSVITLNAGSSLAVEGGQSERRVRLATGEAFFSVAKEAGRPFIVETPSGTVRVTGTSFNLRIEPARLLEVAVVEGSVQVSAGGASRGPVVLAVGERLVATGGSVAIETMTESQEQQVLAWRAGKAVFSSMRLAEALAPFARYHGRALHFDATVADLQVSGRFALDDLDGFLAALETILPVKVTRDLGGAIHVGPRP